MNQGVSVEHAYITSAEAPRLGDEPDSTKWHCNNLNSMFGNWMALLLLYIVPLFLPGVRFLTLSAMMFHFTE